ncbi:alpha/beta fold hydrolase [Mycobacterium colombiense]|uniref:Alpha/beta hydrolase fold protein n=1 Tax=Mycobacterium colombiense CECT 3035 TaxID=1041522 RepID=J4TKB5_9MYCO|nr:alpha/beta hydrolase [Mycobacterium colombiense]EJO90198.1 alpha/beta hydrolase fold protein [Mycobacterium colombiense CECT 3035]
MSTGVYRSLSGQEAVERSYRDHLQRWTVPLRHRTVATCEGETFVLDCGSANAPPVVLLHGAGSNSAIWQADAPRWSQNHRLYMVDVIGEPGLSAPSRPSLDSEGYALWLDDVLDELGVDAPALVGVSLGGWLAIDYAIRRPGRVERLALLAPGVSAVNATGRSWQRWPLCRSESAPHDWPFRLHLDRAAFLPLSSTTCW